MGTALRRAFILALAVGAHAAPSGLTAQGLAPEVRQVVFEGNATFPADSLDRAIVTSATRCRSLIWWLTTPCLFDWSFAVRRFYLSERDVTTDVTRLEAWYLLRGFREVSVDSDVQVDSTRARVVFSIAEGRPVIADSISFEGADEYVDEGLLDDLPIAPGDRWSLLAVDATRDTLVRRLRNRGHPDADVLRHSLLPRDRPYSAEVTFEIQPGRSARYGDIRVEGNYHLDESTVLRTLPFRSGDPYRVGQLADGQARLFGLDIVQSAIVQRDTAAENAGALPDSVVPLFVQVNEGDLYRSRVGGGWSTAECFSTEGRIASRNFRGGGRVLQVRGRLANILARAYGDFPCTDVGSGDFARLTHQLALDFSQPWIFSTRNSFNASLFWERQSVPDIFIRRAVGLDLSIVRAVGPTTPLTLSYTPELSTLDAADVLLCTGFLICTQEDIGILSEARRLAPIGVNLTRDMSNSLLNPTRGYRLIVDLEHASPWTGSEFRYNRALVEGTWYTPLAGSTVLATRLRGGWVGSGRFDPGTGVERNDVVPPQKRFYAGGANSVRGFGQSRLGPRILSVRSPVVLLDSLGVATCAPAELIDLSCQPGADEDYVARPTGGTRVVEGNVEVRVALLRELELVTFTDFGQVWGAGQSPRAGDLEFTPGVGLRYLSPIGPIRLDVGYNFRGSEQLAVVTEQIRSDPGCDSVDDGVVTGDPCLRVDNMSIQYVLTGDLATLEPTVASADTESRFQFHFSIGQAF